jgi:hypothetical protein
MADRTLSQDEMESLFASAPGEAESPSVQVAAASDSAERHNPSKTTTSTTPTSSPVSHMRTFQVLYGHFTWARTSSLRGAPDFSERVWR